MQAAHHRPISLSEAEHMLTYVGSADERETWLTVGMALKDHFGDDAYDAWLRWSANAANFDARAAKASWRGFKRGCSGGITIGSLIKLAHDGGYRRAPGQQGPSADDLAAMRAYRAARAQAAAKQEQERAASAQSAAALAHQRWAAASRSGSSPYLERKGIERPESVRFAPDGGILVPMLRYDEPRSHALKGLQTIAPDGSKRFIKGSAKAGTACRLGLAVVGEPVFVCEGWATACTLRAALDYRWPVFVAFDAYNLPLVTELVYQALPSCPIVICGDDDHATVGRDGLPRNTGRIQAQIAQDNVIDGLGARLVVRGSPNFWPKTPRGPKDTDYNDLARLEGLVSVREQMQLALDCIQELRRYA